MSRKSKKQQRKNVPAAATEGDQAADVITNTGTPGQRDRRVAGICALLVAAVFIVFGQTAWHGFLNYDDGEYVYENPMVSKGLSLEGVRWAFTHVHAANWHPLTTITHMLDCSLYRSPNGLKAGGPHVENVVLHALAAVLLFLTLREMTGALWQCAFVAAVFAIHPLRVESVAWVAERKDVLSGVFFMLTLRAYVRFARGESRGRHNVSRGRYAMVALWFVLGLLSKPMLVTVPCVLLLLDYWPLGRFRDRPQFIHLVVEKLPLFALSGISCIATIVAQKSAIQSTEHFSLLQRIGSALVAYAVYLGKLVYPVGLAVYYPFLKSGRPAWEVPAALLLLLALTAGAGLLRRKQPFVLMGWLWYLGMLVPVIGILQVGGQTYADRYTYLPQIGLAIAAAWAAAEWTGTQRVFLMGAAGMVLCVLAFAACHQTAYWRDNITLWNHTLESTGDNAVARNNLGLALYQQGKIEEAGNQYREALRIDPAYAQFHNNLANVLFRQKRTDEAVAEYSEALKINPDSAVAHNNLGLALLQQGHADEAADECREALRLDPAYTEAKGNLDNTLLQLGQTDDVIAKNREALRLDPANADAHCNIGNALLQQGRTDEAIIEYREALKINPAYPEAHYNLGNALLQQSRTDDAMAEYREAFRLRPDYSEAHFNLGNVLLQFGRTDEAIAQYHEVLKINPASAEAYCNLGNALFQQKKIDESIVQYREAVRINPAYAEALSNLGNALFQQGQAAEGMAQTQKALDLQPANAAIQNSLAWMLVTAPQASLRNGPRAVQLAVQASQSTREGNPLILHTLAAAYAEVNDFSNAVQTAQKALQLAGAQSNTPLADALKREIKLYEGGHRFGDAQ